MNDTKFKIGDRVEILTAVGPRYGRIVAIGRSEITKGTVFKVEFTDGFESWYSSDELRLISGTPIMKVDMKMEINPSDNAQLAFYETGIRRK